MMSPAAPDPTPDTTDDGPETGSEGDREALVMRIICDENDRVPDEVEDAIGRRGIAWRAIVEHLKASEIRGTTVIRGHAGYGTHLELHEARALAKAQHLPVIVETIDDADTLVAMVPDIRSIAPDALITSYTVRVHG